MGEAASHAAIEEVDLNVKVLVGLFETTHPTSGPTIGIKSHAMGSPRQRGWSESQVALKLNVQQRSITDIETAAFRSLRRFCPSGPLQSQTLRQNASAGSSDSPAETRTSRFRNYVISVSVS